MAVKMYDKLTDEQWDLLLRKQITLQVDPKRGCYVARKAGRPSVGVGRSPRQAIEACR